MKTIFFTVFDGDIEKNYLQSEVFKALKDSDNRIVLLLKHGLAKRYAYFADANVVVEELPPSGCFSERLFFWLGWNSIPTYSIYMRRYETYLKHKSKLQYASGRIFGLLGYFTWYRYFLRWIYAQIPDDYARDLFDRYSPDLLFAPSMFSFEDGRLLRMAKRRNIRTVTTSKSWDVLTNKAFTRVIADTILVQNKSIRDIALRFGDYAPESVIIVGFVQFDYVRDTELLISRDAFFKSIGADPTRKLILYSTSGDWKNPYDDEVVEGIHAAIEHGKLEGAQILARFHPKYPSKIEKLDLPHLIKDRPCQTSGAEASIDGVTNEVYSFTWTRDDWAHLANSLFHSDVTVNTMSTITLDAVSFDKPVVLIAHDGNDRAFPYWQALRRTYDETHYRDIINSGCARVGNTMHETVQAIRDYLADSQRDSDPRERLRKEYLFGVDGKAGARIAAAILKNLEQ